jgi:hypothetical protein
MSNEKPSIDSVLQDMHESWRYRWCAGGWCACMGAANCSGGLSGKGYTKEDWEAWVAQNPNPNPEKPIDRDELLRVLKGLHCGSQAVTIEEPAEIKAPETTI